MKNIVERARELMDWASKESADGGSLFDDEAGLCLDVSQAVIDMAEALEFIDKELTIPAGEYIPAILCFDKARATLKKWGVVG